MPVRAIRGAVQAESNNRAAIGGASRQMIMEMLKRNSVSIDEIIAVFFTVTSDLNADFPARAVREQGSEWSNVAFQCTMEMEVPGSMRRVIRVLMLCETTKAQADISHVFLGETARLRPDLAGESPQ